MRPFTSLRAASVAFALAVALPAGLLGSWTGPASAATADRRSPAADRAGGPPAAAIPEDKRTELLGADYRTSTDRAVATSGDATGFHILTAARAEGYAWKTVASLSEPGFDTDSWIGNACITGSGTRAVVVYAPRTFTNEAELMARGGFTAIVDLTTGKVTKLAQQASLSYYNPGCGAGETAVLTLSGGEDKPATRFVEVDAASGEPADPVTVDGQLTSAVPARGGIVAAAGGRLVTVGTDGGTKTLAATRSVAYRLTPDAAGGLAFLEKAADARTTVRHLPRGSGRGGGEPRVLATGPRTDTGLARAASGELFITGATETAGRLPATVTHAPGTPARSLASTTGDALVTGTVWADGKDSRISAAEAARPRPVNVGLRLLDAPGGERPEKEFTVTPGTLPSVHAADGSAMSAALSRGAGKAAPPASARAASPTDPVEDERVCSVPRNDPKNQAMQPKPRQVEWAVNQAVTGNLNKHISRPAGWKNLGMPAYQPQTLFPRPALEGGGRVPAQVMLGVTAQESNMWQAARSAVPGVTGNPLIGNYYGIDYYDYTTANDWDVDWSEADCGYGITQVTDHMRRAGREDGGPTAWPYDKQRAVALDYTANIAAGLQILSDKWNQTRRAGLILNNGDVKRLENWFFALWAYNSGFYPESDAGKYNGAWGVGWANNPANPEWDAGRSPFMEDRLGNDDYADAAHPQDWPYQEKVIGFAAHPPELLEAPNKLVAGFRPAWWNGTDGDATVKGSAKYHRALAKPPEDLFCSDLNDCRPDKIGDDASNDDSTTGPCVRGDFRCWWNTSAAWKADCDYTCGNEFVRFNDTYPEEADGTAYPPNCDLNGLPAGALVVDDVPNGTRSVRPNCSPQLSIGGTFSFDFGEGETRPPDPTRYWPGKVDTHQIGGGFNGHFYFTHTRKGDAKGERLKVTGNWNFDTTVSGPAQVLVHLPDHGAHTKQARYRIETRDGPRYRTVQQPGGSNRWLNLGAFMFGNKPKVSLTSVTPDGTGDEDIAFDAVAVKPIDGTYVEDSVSAVAYFDEDQNLDPADEARKLNTPFASRQDLHDWAIGTSGGVTALPTCPNGGVDTDCAGARTEAAMQKWNAAAQAAGTHPTDHPDGKSIPAWLKFSNPVGQRPTSVDKPSYFDSDDGSYKIRTKAKVSYVKTGDGKIVDGSEYVEYSSRTGDTHLPDFVTDTFQAIEADYGIAPPDMNYSAMDLNDHDGTMTTTDTNSTGVLPGREYQGVGKKPVITDKSNQPTPGGTCVASLYTSGGSIGYRVALASEKVTGNVGSWKSAVEANGLAPASVKKLAGEIYNAFFKPGLTGSLFNSAGPIWQELNFSVCTDGTVISNSGRPLLRSSYMPNQYLYRNGKAVGLDGKPATGPAPVITGDYEHFTNAIDLTGVDVSKMAYGDCGATTGRGGNPWGIDPLDSAGANPSGHFCVDASLQPDPQFSDK
ncbi:golvesin C-terminal-like domain-containing protein [Streptomyces phytophilus]|uniref:golvesin C-terminal-like domain-containing protein n=1 Tax=Streptomyces phytophilus TaxID=722715 RepID=UPI0015F0BFEF|nr:hypothetical protein [Streptomyces phytophilus]